MRNLSIPLEGYYEVNNHYPYAASGPSWVTVGISTTEVSSGYTPLALTTPVVQISSLPDDPYYATAVQNPAVPATWCYRYATTPVTCWILASNGPDQDIDIPLEVYVDKDGCQCDITKLLTQYGGPYVEYDPTNGTTSNGDIIRTGP